MSRRPFLARWLALAVSAVLATTGCGKSPPVSTTSAEGRFTVAASGELEESVDATGWRMSAWDDDDRGFIVKWSDLPAAGMPPPMVKELYDTARDGAVRVIAGTVRSERDRDVAGYPGREVVADGTVDEVPATMHVRMVIVAARLYVLVTLAPRGEPEDPAVAFLDSFAVAAPPAAPSGGGLPAGFTPQTVAADGFSVVAPGVPQHQGSIYVWNWVGGLGLVSVAFADLDEPVAAADAAKVLDQARDAELEPARGGKIVAERAVDVPGALASREVDWTRPDPDGTWRGVSRFVIVGARSWTVTVQSLSTTPDLAGMRAVAASFAVGKQ